MVETLLLPLSFNFTSSVFVLIIISSRGVLSCSFSVGAKTRCEGKWIVLPDSQRDDFRSWRPPDFHARSPMIGSTGLRIQDRTTLMLVQGPWPRATVCDYRSHGTRTFSAAMGAAKHGSLTTGESWSPWVRVYSRLWCKKPSSIPPLRQTRLWISY